MSAKSKPTALERADERSRSINHQRRGAARRTWADPPGSRTARGELHEGDKVGSAAVRLRASAGFIRRAAVHREARTRPDDAGGLRGCAPGDAEPACNRARRNRLTSRSGALSEAIRDGQQL